MKKILITGGAGYIGSHTCIELIESGHIPIIVDNFSNSERWVIDRIKKITGVTPVVYEGDCRDADFLAEVFTKEADIDGVIHFAGLKVVGESIENPLAYYDNNLRSLTVLLGVMQLFHTKYFVFSSSAAVYGDQKENPISEEAEIKVAMSPYGTTKIVAEGIVRDIVKSGVDLNAVVLRYFNPIGAHPSGHIGEIPAKTAGNVVQYLSRVAAGIEAKMVVHGDDYDTIDGSGVRDFIHVTDLARAHVATLEFLAMQSRPYLGTFNVGTGHGTSVLELIDTFKKVTGVDLIYEIGPRRTGDIPVSYAKNTRIIATLGWHPKFNVEDAIRDMWRWEGTLKRQK